MLREEPVPDIDFSEGMATSVGNLEPGHPLLAVVAEWRFRKGFAAHSIVAKRDTLVTAKSASIAWAESEKLVDTSHRGALDNGGSVAEIMRILRLHIAEPPK